MKQVMREIKISNKALAQIVYMELSSRGYSERVADEFYEEVSQDDGYIIIRESDGVKILDEREKI